MNAERTLAWLLRVVGAVCLLGVVGLLLPAETMADIHASAGLGEFPDEPIADYLARATSALCGLFGALMIFLSTDVRRYRGVIAFQAYGILILSGALVVASLGSGRLLGFVIADAAACWAYTLPVLWLLRKTRDAG